MNKPHDRGAKKNEHLWFDELSMNEAEKAAKTNKVIILPIGSVEEHGEHLPLATDSIQPEYVATEVAKKTRCLVAPTLRYGVCNSTRGFPGTISISFDALYKIVKDILEEFVRNGFKRILIMSGHAGQSHMSALRLAAQEVIRASENKPSEKTVRIMVCSDYDFAYELKGKHFSDEDGHAGTIETARIMAIRPDLVKTKGRSSYPEMPRFEIILHPEKLFPSGVIGDPTTATSKKGHMINDYVIENIVKLVQDLMR